MIGLVVPDALLLYHGSRIMVEPWFNHRFYGQRNKKSDYSKTMVVEPWFEHD